LFERGLGRANQLVTGFWKHSPAKDLIASECIDSALLWSIWQVERTVMKAHDHGLMFEQPPLQRRARSLGYAGQLPQVLAIILLADPETRWIALAGGYGYAALIFSFLGGVWWGIGISNPQAPRWIYVAAVLPSLIGLATYVPWIFGWAWPGPSLIVLGLCLLVSPAVDREMALKLPLPDGWVRLRSHLSVGLGLLTLLLAAAAFTL